MNHMPNFQRQLRTLGLFSVAFAMNLGVPGVCNQAMAQGNSGQDYPGQRGRERAAERAAEHAVENILKKAVESQVESQVAASVEATVEQQVNNASDRANEVRRSDEARANAPGQLRKFDIQQRVERRVALEIERDAEGFPRVRNRWLIMTDDATLQELALEGYQVDDVNRLDGLDAVLVEVVEPAGADLEKARRSDFDVVSKTLEVDFDHLYQPDGAADEVPKSRKGELGSSPDPHELLRLPSSLKYQVSLGVIDSAVDQDHPVFSSSKLHYRDFVETEGERPKHHGTAVASILVGNQKQNDQKQSNKNVYQGLITNSQLFSAGVFFNDSKYGQRATVKSLVLAINWMAKENIDVVNVSLTGPENRILKAALEKLHEKGALVVAAVGNEGPTAKPLFPAGYDFVVAVTATNAKNFAYHKANRGKHVDIAAPGVAIKHAQEGGGFSESSGTSFAAPFVSAYLAAELASARKSQRLEYRNEVLRSMFSRAKDLGQLGRDEVYGHGLIQAP